jgi:hypothetical protein
MFLHPMGYAAHVVHSGACGPRNIGVQFFMLGWDRCGFHKKRVATLYTKLVFFYPVGSAGQLVHSRASRP